MGVVPSSVGTLTVCPLIVTVGDAMTGAVVVVVVVDVAVEADPADGVPLEHAVAHSPSSRRRRTGTALRYRMDEVP
jgi:hypothetical protein